MSDTLPEIRAILEASPYAYEIMECDPELADTAVFCERYGKAPEDSANTILVRSKTGDLKYAACVVLATHRLDVNKVVRKKLEARKVSFASAEETKELTGQEIGGVTALGLPADLPLWIDADVMARKEIILGGGNRSSKLIVDPKLLLDQPCAEVVEGLANPIAL
ncbi:YbaK/EbsC family protein [Nisaea nitritireducens]|uniref:YbaK/EbsC family protein n=1 Tax=Nisaea nitritireducens TaxID=568392 RepID=UPI0018689377|nr:YbaK/EbsC family protein [Nisaea nitritireducens]